MTGINEALDKIRSLEGQSLGNGQCYALSAYYENLITPNSTVGLGAGVNNVSGAVGDTIRASEIGNAYKWSANGWTVLVPKVASDIRVGSIINIKPFYDYPFLTGEFGHTGIVTAIDGRHITVHEQNYNGKQYVVANTYVLDQNYVNGISSLVYPPTEQSQGRLTIVSQIRETPQVGVVPYKQIHAHSTGNPRSTAQNEADYMSRKDLNTGFYTHVVGNGQVIQTAEVNRGAWDVGGGWNYETYAAVELIESHQNKADFMRDYALYVNLLRQLADESGLPKTLDSGDSGIISHAYATANQPDNCSDHVDPYPYLAKWGISQEQFAHDLARGVVISKMETTNVMLSKTETVGAFKVRVAISDLNIRKDPSLSAGKRGYCPKGVYTIVDTKRADGYDWGKLKSGQGWVALDFTKRL